MTIRTLNKQLPDFICKTPSIPHTPALKRDPCQPLMSIYLLRLALGLKNELAHHELEDLLATNIEQSTAASRRAKANLADDLSFDEAFYITTGRKRSTATVCKHIKNRLNQLLVDGMQIDSPFFKNIHWLACELQLNACDQEILVLSLLVAFNQSFRNSVKKICKETQVNSVLNYLQLMTARPLEVIEHSLSSSSPLSRIGWLNLADKRRVDQLLISPTLFSVLFDEHTSSAALCRLFFKPLKPSVLVLETFPTLQNELTILIPYLARVLANHQVGVNILIYGVQNSGKKELARLLATCVDSRLYAISTMQTKSRKLESPERLAACQLAQYRLAQQNESAMILVDQADKLLPHLSDFYFFVDDDEEQSPSINPIELKQQMRNNPLPIIWIMNEPKGYDPCILRRFNFTLELNKMPEALRQTHIANVTRNLPISEVWRQQLTKHTDIPLSQITKAAVIAEHGVTDSSLSAETIMSEVLNSHGRLFNRSPINGHRPITGYDLCFTNTDIVLQDLLAGLQSHPHGNFCFYGASGTGKTAFARHLAEQLGLPIHIKRASDILDMYVGESEKNMADMFREAQQDGAMLLLDEADSLLSDRREARNHWEISKVNEMLTQMEQFQGIFICTTNLMEKMDTASLRRFDFKVKFDYLRAEQRWALFVQESQRLALALPDDAAQQAQLRQQIQRLTRLTPGDFAVFNRQARLLKTPLALNNMIAVLEKECLAKGEAFSQIGFVH